MSQTLDRPMDVLQARAALANTARLSSDQVDAAQRVVNAFYAQKPRKACAACGCLIWSEHNGGVWGCDRCHRGPELTQAEFNAAEAARRKATDDHLAAVAAATPPPRTILRERLAALAEARNALEKHERAVPTAQSAAWEAQARHDRAVEAAEATNATAAEGLAVAFFEGIKPIDPSRAAAAARGESAASADALIIAKNARAILDSKLKEARSAVGYAADRCRKAANGVLVAERLEELLADVAENRAQYLECVGQLGWLIKTHMIPANDRRAHQFLGEANVPPRTWREAQSAGNRGDGRGAGRIARRSGGGHSMTSTK